MSGENDAVDREEGYAAFGSSGDVATVDGKHVSGHVGRQIVDDHLKFCRENIGSRLRFDACEDLNHTTREINKSYSGEWADLLRSKALKSLTNVVQSRVRQLGCDSRDRLFRNFAESWTRQVSREGHSSGRVRRVHLNGRRELNVDQRVLMMFCGAPVLGVPDRVSGMVRTTRCSSTAAARGALNATPDLGRRGVFRVESFGGLDHDGEEVELLVAWYAIGARSYKPRSGGQVHLGNVTESCRDTNRNQ